MVVHAVLIRRCVSAAAFSVLWIVAAVLTPDVTFHLAPVIVAAAPAFAGRGRPILWGVVGFVLASGISVALALSGFLDGPSLLPVGGPLLESIVGALVGAVVGGLFDGRVTASD
ncbi:MAG: hypothetical protein WD532_00755 [Acidimicrobiia bacterium]